MANNEANIRQIIASNFGDDILRKVKFFSGPPAVRGQTSLWTRDHGPLSVASDEGNFLFGFAYNQEEQIARTALANANNFLLREASDSFEPGNFMSSEDGVCAMMKGKTLPAEAVLKEQVGCQKVLLVPQLPNFLITTPGGPLGEKSPPMHIDLVAKFLPGKRVAVATLSNQKSALAGITDNDNGIHDNAVEDLNTLKRYFNDVAKCFPGFEVERTPAYVTKANRGTVLKIGRLGDRSTWNTPAKTIYNWILSSTTNSLLLGENMAIVPTFAKVQEAKSDESEITEIYKRAGYNNVHFIAADHLAMWGGGWHCASMQIPIGTFQPADSCAAAPLHVALSAPACHDVRAGVPEAATRVLPSSCVSLPRFICCVQRRQTSSRFSFPRTATLGSPGGIRGATARGQRGGRAGAGFVLCGSPGGEGSRGGERHLPGSDESCGRRLLYGCGANVFARVVRQIESKSYL